MNKFNASTSKRLLVWSAVKRGKTFNQHLYASTLARILSPRKSHFTSFERSPAAPFWSKHQGIFWNVYTYERGPSRGTRGPLLNDLLLSGEEQPSAQQRAALIVHIVQVIERRVTSCCCCRNYYYSKKIALQACPSWLGFVSLNMTMERKENSVDRFFFFLPLAEHTSLWKSTFLFNTFGPKTHQLGAASRNVKNEKAFYCFTSKMSTISAARSLKLRCSKEKNKKLKRKFGS